MFFHSICLLPLRCVRRWTGSKNAAGAQPSPPLLPGKVQSTLIHTFLSWFKGKICGNDHFLHNSVISYQDWEWSFRSNQRKSNWNKVSNELLTQYLDVPPAGTTNFQQFNNVTFFHWDFRMPHCTVVS